MVVAVTKKQKSAVTSAFVKIATLLWTRMELICEIYE